jgi:hypothetical protein
MQGLKTVEKLNCILSDFNNIGLAAIGGLDPEKKTLLRITFGPGF